MSAGVLAGQYGIPFVFVMGGVAYLVGALSVGAYVAEADSRPKSSETVSQRTDNRIHWQDLLQRNLLVFIATSTLNGLIQGAYGLFPLYLNKLGASDALVGLSVAVGAMAEVPVMIYAGGLSDRIGRKAVLTFAYLVPTLTFALIGQLSDPYLLLMAFSLKGVSGGVDFGLSAIYLADEVPPERRSLIYGLVNSLKSVGTIIGPYVVAVVADRYGMANMFLFIAAYNLIPATLFALGTKTKKPKIEIHSP
jgi:MFS family permease